MVCTNGLISYFSCLRVNETPGTEIQKQFSSLDGSYHGVDIHDLESKVNRRKRNLDW